MSVDAASAQREENEMEAILNPPSQRDYLSLA